MELILSWLLKFWSGALINSQDLIRSQPPAVIPRKWPNWFTDEFSFIFLRSLCHFSNIFVHFVFCQLIFIVLFPFLITYYHILFIIIVFRLCSDTLVSCFFYGLSSRDQSRNAIPRFGEGGLFFISDVHFIFCLLKFIILFPCVT